MDFLWFIGGKNMDLYEWTREYIRFKDIIQKRIKKLEEKESIILVEEKNKTKTYIIVEKLNEGVEKLNKHDKKEHLIITTLNTENNSKELISSWDELLKYEDLTIIFCHPGTNEKWLIHPKSHDKISEKKQLKEGVRTLLESITIID